MTIKKRLARSNIIMLVIPVLGVVIGVLTFRRGGTMLEKLLAAFKRNYAA